MVRRDYELIARVLKAAALSAGGDEATRRALAECLIHEISRTHSGFNAAVFRKQAALPPR